MTTLKLTALGTLWVAVCIAAFFWFGMTFIHDESGASFYYGLGWIVTGVLAGVPFLVYHQLEH